MMKNTLLLLLVLLGGCTTVGTKVVENVTTVPDGKGIIVFSTGADKTNLLFSTELRLVQGETRKWYDKVIIQIDFPTTSHFSTEHAHGRSLTLPEGDYFIIPSSSNPYFCLVKFPTYHFTVKGGTVTYLGSFQLSSNQLTLTPVNYQRDVQHFAQKNPGLKAQLPIANVEIGAERYNSCGESLFTKGIIWEAPQ